MPVRIKICGFTQADDLRAALVLGVDAIGLNLARGPRKITVAQAGELARLVPPLVAAVALFADADEAAILAAMAATRCSAVQLHGDEPPELAERLRGRFQVIKAFAVSDAASLAKVRGYPADAYLLDTPSTLGGGSGKSWDHKLIAGAVLDRPLILAGGLNPTDVAAAIAQARPWAVDVASGVESSPGRKDPVKMRAFIAACRSAA